MVLQFVLKVYRNFQFNFIYQTQAATHSSKSSVNHIRKSTKSTNNYFFSKCHTNGKWIKVIIFKVDKT